jgi:uncharacterized protein (DUF169 family)
MERSEAAEFLSNELRLRTLPVGVKFLKDKEALPEDARRPSKMWGKKVTICQGVTLARLYRWTVGLTKEDLICVPAMIAFGLTKAKEQGRVLGRLFCEVAFAKSPESSVVETAGMCFLPSGEYGAMMLAPLAKSPFEPDTVVIYGNPAQVMRMIQGWVYSTGKRIPGNFGGKVECTEYLIAPFTTSVPRVAIPGNGDRIFSMTQDDEMAFAVPGQELGNLVEGLKQAGKKVGARYPVTFYQNFQPEFPKPYKELGAELDAL